MNISLDSWRQRSDRLMPRWLRRLRYAAVARLVWHSPINYEIIDDSIHVSSFDFTGKFSASAQGNYRIAYSVAAPPSVVSAESESAESGTQCHRVLLIKQNNMWLDITVPNPQATVVSDKGTWAVISGTKKGYIYVAAYDRHGMLLLKEPLESPFDSMAISADGSTLLVQTGYTYGGHQNNSMLVFDLKQGRRLATIPYQGGAPKRHRIETKERRIYGEFNDGRQDHIYDFSGNFINKAAWEKEQLDYISGYEVLNKANGENDALESTNLTDYRSALSLYERVLSSQVTDGAKADALKSMAKIHQHCGDNAQALRYFQEAKQRNPDAGVDDMIAKLRREV